MVSSSAAALNDERHSSRRVVRFDPATEEQLQEWKEGKRPLWRFELMWPDGKWETQGMCDRVELN